MDKTVTQISVFDIDVPDIHICDKRAVGSYVDFLNQFGELAQPLLVWQSPDGRHMLMEGLDRLEACKKVGKKMVPVDIVNDPDCLTARIFAVPESSSGRVKLLRHLVRAGALTVAQVKERFGLDVSPREPATLKQELVQRTEQKLDKMVTHRDALVEKIQQKNRIFKLYRQCFVEASERFSLPKSLVVEIKQICEV